MKMNRRGTFFLGAVVLVCTSIAQGGMAPRGGIAGLYGIPTRWDANPHLLHLIDPSDGSTISTIGMTSPDGEVRGGNGLASDPATNILYAVLQITGQGRTLVTLDPATGVASSIGVLADSVAGIAFDATGTLYGVTGDGADVPETLYTLSTIDASMTFFLTLGNGRDGESIGFNPDDGLMYHSSGIDTHEKVWEAIDLSIPAVVNKIIIEQQPPGEFSAFTYAGGGVFYMADLASGTSRGEFGSSGFFTIDTDGNTVQLGSMDFYAKGLAIVVPEPTSLMLLTFVAVAALKRRR
jgi:hypothetical protein